MAQNIESKAYTMQEAAAELGLPLKEVQWYPDNDFWLGFAAFATICTSFA